uniref:Uncharacterized protein n=1 Tax=Acrobeloides nanus TaxID=290746 RepID=A0A914D584_9BILA
MYFSMASNLIRNFAIQQNSLPSPTVPSTSIASTSTNSQRIQSNNQPSENASISNQPGLTARKLCAATLLFSNGTRDFSILHVELDQASFLIPFMPAYVSGNGLVYDSLKSIKIDCCIDVPCAYDMEAFLNVCQGLAPSMGNLTWIIPESPKLGYDRFCKVLRNLQEAPQIQRIVEKANVNGVGFVKTIVFIGNIAYEILKVTRYPLCYI